LVLGNDPSSDALSRLDSEDAASEVLSMKFLHRELCGDWVHLDEPKATRPSGVRIVYQANRMNRSMLLE